MCSAPKCLQKASLGGGGAQFDIVAPYEVMREHPRMQLADAAIARNVSLHYWFQYRMIVPQGIDLVPGRTL